MPNENENKKSWPKNVTPLLFDDGANLGVDEKNNLYWNGIKLATKLDLRFAKTERRLAIIAVIIAIVGVVMQIWPWFCDLQWLSSCLCPPVEQKSEGLPTDTG